MSEIGNTGSFVQSGGTTFLVGGSSGIDTSALIDVAVAQRTREADNIDVKIATNDLRSSGLTTLQDLGAELQASLTALRGAFGISSTDGAIFDAKAGSLVSNTATAPESLVNLSIDETAVTGTNNIVIEQKAEAIKVASDPTTDPLVALGLNGTFQLRLAGQATVNINIVGTDTLQDIADKINVESGNTSVSASIVKVTENDFKLVLSGDQTGLSMKRVVGAGDNVLQSIGILDGANAYKDVVQLNQMARLQLNGVDISRTSNSIDDLLTGVTFDIVGEDVGTTLTLDIGSDEAGVKAAIEGFVESFNTLRDFVLQNSVVSGDGEVSDEAPLFGDNLMDGLNRSLQSLFGRNYLGTGGVETLAEIGIEFDASNKLTIDSVVLDTAIVDKFDEVQALFQSKYSADNTEFDIIRNESQVQSLNFALDITYSGGAITNVAVGGDNTLFDISGSSITGKVGTIYDGLVFAYVGTTSTTVNINFEQGFADLAVNRLEGYVNSVDSLIQREKLSIEDQNDGLADRAERVRERAEDYRARLIDRYASFEAQLARSKSIIAQLRAILGTSDDDS